MTAADHANTALYRCDVCENVVRYTPGHTSLGHIHYDDQGVYLGKKGEGKYIEFPDDGRDGVDDLRDSVWIAS